jgi:hypothetical protein
LATGTTTPSPGATVTPTVADQCIGDCSGEGQVTVDELVTMIVIGLGNLDVEECVAGDANHDGLVTVEEIVSAVNRALEGCV